VRGPDRSGVNVPAVRMVDPVEGVLGIEWIEGQSVRHLLPGGAEEEGEEPRPEAGQSNAEEEVDVDPLLEFHIDQGTSHSTTSSTCTNLSLGTDTLMDMIGGEIAKMHGADIIHGDLTTSNMMLRHPLSCPPSLPTELVTFPLLFPHPQTEF
jgi:tRNA A-37 threonylcarbamoyl transferase component Bud32